MIELYIDGTAAVIPSDMSTDIVIANSFFTKNGEYTYDIKLSLRNSINAALYKQLNRLNSVSEVTSKRRAVLVMDNRVYIDGTEIITDWDDDSVSLQLASGNSELNYFIGSDELISSYGLGYASGSFIQTLDSPYPASEFVGAPVYNRTADEVVNDLTFHESQGGINMGQPLYAQPYLCTMIEKLIIAMGYKIGVNQIASSQFKDLFILNVVSQYEYGKMLPGWTVKEFFEEIEKLLNITFVIDKKTKVCNILFANTFFIGAQEIHLTAVEDDYEVEIDEQSEGDITTSNITYDLPSNEYFKFRKVSKAILDKANKIDVAGLDKVRQWYDNHVNDGSMTVITDTTTGRKYCAFNTSSDNKVWDARPIDEFCDLDREASNEIKLSICPAELYLYHFNNGDMQDTWCKIPVLDCDAASEVEEGVDGSIQKMIEEDTEEKTESKGQIFLAFYEGMAYHISVATYKYPLSTPDQWDFLPTTFSWDENKSLRLSVLNRLLYSGVYSIDTTKKYTFYTSDPNVPDAHGIFVINNKRFVCKEMTFSISKCEKVKRWKLSAYPITISDTEAMSRWILTDGKWRDGGVWLDDGRWLD